MASVSEDRKQHDQQIRYWDSKGMSQRGIARKLGISRGLVQRVLAETPVLIAAQPEDPDDLPDVQAEFDGLVESARASNSIDGWRHVHDVVKTCYANGYRVKYNPLPLLMVLSDLSADTTGDVWEAYSAEIKAVYQWMRDAKVGNYAIGNDRRGVPEFRLAGDSF